VSAGQLVPGDWYSGTIPSNTSIDATALIETSYSFDRFRSTTPAGVTMGRGSSAYLATMFDVGPSGTVSIGDFVLLVGVRFICDTAIVVGDYSLLSWNVVIMDTFRAPAAAAERRRALELASLSPERVLPEGPPGRPVTIERNVWIGFDVCILPGITIGEGSIVGARSTLVEDVPPYTVVAGNPAAVVRTIDRDVSDD
jgi:acetyltransferase-like isoleucine patch superfamily enzyme